MNRPTITKEMITEAAKQIAEKIEFGDADDITEHYRHHMDGYELAKDLEMYAGWDLTMRDVEELDGMSSIVDKLYREAEQKWYKENDIQPPLSVGTKITKGVIEGIDEHSAARYLVKETGCTKQNRWLLVKFEDAVAA